MSAVLPDSTPVKLLEEPGDALLVVDVQRDFLPGGALAVPRGDAVIAPLNAYLSRAAGAGTPIFASRDWHPSDHCSFRAQGGIWPPHCVAGTQGSQFAPGLELPPQTRIIDKATQAERDAYSAFQDTGLAQALREAGVKRLAVGGLATDYCVLQSVLDALAAGFEVVVLDDAIAAVDVHPGDGENARDEMRRVGARLLAA
jgi:nicotinamidase/pyrazinamidase